MEKLESQTSKEAAWRSRLLRHAQSGKSIAAFCQDESVSTASFHIWRAKLGAASGHAAELGWPPVGCTTSTRTITSSMCCSVSASIRPYSCSSSLREFGRRCLLTSRYALTSMTMVDEVLTPRRDRLRACGHCGCRAKESFNEMLDHSPLKHGRLSCSKCHASPAAGGISILIGSGYPYHEVARWR